MHVVFCHSDKDREVALAHSFLKGARRHGHTTQMIPLGDEALQAEGDLVCMVGVKSKRLWEAVRARGHHTLMFDKGYSRHRGANRTWEYWRLSLDAHQPTMTTLMRVDRPSDRFEAMGWELAPWREDNDGPIVFAGSSGKYHEFYDMPEPTEWARGVIRQIRKLTSRPIIYRPKPSWKEAVPIKGSIFSNPNETLGAQLASAWALVTHGSNACVEAAVAGIPSIVLGNAVARPISTTVLKFIEEPEMEYREQWLANLAYQQWTEAEMASGEAWLTVGEWINA